VEQVTQEQTSAMGALRAGTHDAHVHAESVLSGSSWLDGPEQYERFLLRLLRFHEQVEALLPSALAYAPVRRSVLIRADLAFLTGAACTLPPAAVLPGGTAAALGRLYVVEGSALGGRVLLRQITARLGHDAGRGASCFAPHGRQTLPRWRAFGRAVDAWAASHPLEVAPMVAAAGSCFATYELVVVRP
jgi:heme oxygenase